MIEDKLDRKILNALQEEFPLHQRPFKVIGEMFGISEQEAMQRVQGLIDRGVIRRMGPVFNYGDMDLVGVLVAAKMPPESADKAEEIFKDIPAVTHAYLRDHEYNLWFTVIAEEEDLERIIFRLSRELNLADVTRLPRYREFKLDTVFEAK